MKYQSILLAMAISGCSTTPDDQAWVNESLLEPPTIVTVHQHCTVHTKPAPGPAQVSVADEDAWPFCAGALPAKREWRLEGYVEK